VTVPFFGANETGGKFVAVVVLSEAGGAENKVISGARFTRRHSPAENAGGIIVDSAPDDFQRRRSKIFRKKKLLPVGNEGEIV